MINRAVRDRLLASTIIAGAIVAGTPAFAQATGTTTGQTSTPSGEQNTQSAGGAEPNSQGEIVVTGSLIKNPALISSAPVQVLGQEEVQLRQTNTAEEILRDLPGAVADVGSAVNNGNGGASFVNLRGLGSQRNLVLLDGNRITPAGLSGQVDLNNIPLALVQRTEVLTGGASTTYGADAIAGVVNFITRSDFSGVEVGASKQITGQGDGAYYRADITIGANFDDGKGNAVFSVGYQHSDAVYQGDRPFGQFLVDSFSGAGGGSGTTVPARFNFGKGNMVVNPATGAFRAYKSATDAFNYNPYNVYQTPFERFNMYGAGHYDVSDNVTIYTRGLFSKNTVNTIIAPSGAFGTLGDFSQFSVPYDNPYLPTAARQQICAANGLAATANCGAGTTFNTTIGRRAVETGPRLDSFQTQIFDYRAGIKGNITSSLHFDVAGSYGESTNTHAISGYTLLSRIQDALLATNTTTCTSGHAGCVPINVFGGAGTLGGNVNSGAALAYLQAGSSTAVATTLGQVRGVISGDFGYHSPFATDAINFAVGGEYRKYTAAQTADQLANSGDLGGNNGAINVFSGRYDVTEGFAEIIAPLVQDAKFAKSLTLEGGIRYSHYHIFAPTTSQNLTPDEQLQLAAYPSILSSSAASFNATTYKGGLTYEPVNGIKIRGVYQHAVRAPNISELFRPATSTLTTITVDPCGGTKPVGNTLLTAVCRAQGAPASQIGLIELQPSAGQGSATQYGNLNLKPEKSDSFTVGLVLQPKEYIPGLSVTVDYYHIKIKQAISFPSSGDILGACFNNLTAASATSSACTSIRRNTDGTFDGGAGLALVLSNVGKYLTDGIDLGLNYRRDLGFAVVNASFEGNWTHRAIFQSSPASAARECVGFYGPDCGLNGGSLQPKFYWNQRTTITYHNVDLSLLWRHINHMAIEPGLGSAYVGALSVPASTYFNGKQVDFNRIKAFNYFDLSTRISAGDHLEFTVTVQNLLNKQPPLVGGSIGTTAFNSGNTYPSTYDTLGRRFAVGAKIKF